MQTVYTAKHGLMAQQHRMNAIASNFANVSTAGYKSQSVAFKDALYTQMINPENVASDANLKQGSGVLMASANRDFRLGTPSETQQQLDFYIDGDGFFTVSDGERTLYTRNGAFASSIENDQRYLVTGNGYYVLDESGQRIQLPADLSGMTLSADGTLSFAEGGSAKLSIVTFTNKEGLTHDGNSFFLASEASGELERSEAGVMQGRLEASNVDVALEMTKLIRTQRAYSIAARVLSTWNDMAAETNNIL